ncbi:hypothetical protein [Pontibacter sp. H249]|uniref:hypothetical protein n=1 Tax=Pontibacter sp. H249 TaxID=3133420 RepID=UPI0030C019D8
MTETSTPPPIRELLDSEPYLPRVIRMAQADGHSAQRATISDVVLGERTTSKYWKYIEILAKEKYPTLYEERMAYLRETRGQDKVA